MDDTRHTEIRDREFWEEFIMNKLQGERVAITKPMFQIAWQSPPTNPRPDGKFNRVNGGFVAGAKFDDTVQRRTLIGDAVYRSVYNFAEWKDNRPVANSCIVDRIYIDLDDKNNPQAALDDAATIAQYFNGHTTQWFSGKKGVGMEILCYPVDLLPEMKSAVLRRWTYTLIAELGITTADPAVIGDINRVHRIIDTRHQDTGLYAIGLSQSELSDILIDDVKKLATTSRGLEQNAHPSMDVATQLFHVEEVILIERLRVFVNRKMLAQKTFDSIAERLPDQTDSRDVVFEFIRSLDAEYQHIVSTNSPRVAGENKWLTDAEDMLRTNGQLTDGRDRGKEHQKRVHFVKYAHECGWSPREICSAFVNIVDGNGKRCYDAAMTEAQVRSCIR